MISSGQVIDRDGDGHSDLWQIFHGISSANGDEDSDGDGFSDAQEEAAGTNAFSPVSLFQVEHFQLLSHAGEGGQAHFEWDALAGKNYQLEKSGDLMAESWLDFGPPISLTTSGPITLDLIRDSGLARQFFRGKVSDVDEDRDGLSKFEELLIGTSDLTSNSGGAGGPSDAIKAAEWAEEHDPGFTSEPQQPNLKEVDVAFVREVNADTGGGGADIVTVTGTGSWHQMTSWRSFSSGSNPLHLATAPPVQGHHAKMHVLTPATNSAAPKFITGGIRFDGSLAISCRSLAPLNGKFVHHKTAVFATNPAFQILEYDIAHRAITSGAAGVTSYQVLAPYLIDVGGFGTRQVRVAVFTVNPASGAVAFQKTSIPLSGPVLAALPKLRIAHIGDNQFELIYTSSGFAQVHHAIWVSTDGTIGDGGGDTLPFDIRGNGSVTFTPQAAEVTGLTGSGYATAIRQEGELKLAVWDRRPDRLLPNVYKSHLLTDHSQDLNPIPGLGLAAPLLRDSFEPTQQADERVGTVVATGDFNGDQIADGVIGAPGRDVDGLVDAGGVYLMEGDFSGIKDIEAKQLWTQNSDGLVGSSAGGDTFGGAVVAGDFNNDGYDDLAIGIPLKDLSGKSDAGAVQILYGTPSGLLAAGNQLITRDSIGQTSAAGDRFAQALVAGDFNNDGHDDLAIGAPGENVSGEAGAGAVHVLYGVAAGLSTSGAGHLHQDFTGLADQAEAGDAFGQALASGDLNGDGKADLAIGVPLENISSATDAGAVQVVYGATGGFSGSNFISRDGFSGGSDIAETPTSGDNFGWSLAVGDFNKDNADDLAIGVPGDSDSGIFTGAIHVLHGTFLGLTWFNEEFIRQTGSLPAAQSLPSGAAANEDLGWSLAAGDCDGDGFADLVASAPGEDSPTMVDVGMIFVIRGSTGGLLPQTAVMIQQGRSRSEGDDVQTADNAQVAGDKFGISLACGDFNLDGEADILTGIPRKDANTTVLGTGAVHYISGSSSFTITLSNDFMWIPQRRELVRGIVTDLIRETGPGFGKLYAQNENQPVVNMASSTKTMTLLLAVEAVEAGDVSLDDEVTVSPLLAGITGGSTLPLRDANANMVLDGNQQPTIFLQAGDKMPLKFMLAAMMGESCNRASVAIGQFISEKLTGNADNFIMMMNTRAGLLGMSTSTFGHAAGGWVCKIQDAVNLQKEGVKHPLFLKFASFERWGDNQPDEVLCGTNAADVLKCNGPFIQFSSMDTYPGRHSWKGGNGFLWSLEGEANNIPASPPASRCTFSRVCTALRMDRTLAACLQQTGSADEDVQRLLDRGYRQLFTPDLRDTVEFPEGGGLVGPEGPLRVKNFAIDGWDGFGVTAVIDDNEEMKLNVWKLNYATNQMDFHGNSVRKYPLVSGTKFQEAALVGLADLSTRDAIADHFTAHLIGERLELKMWRAGEEP